MAFQFDGADGKSAAGEQPGAAPSPYVSEQPGVNDGSGTVPTGSSGNVQPAATTPASPATTPASHIPEAETPTEDAASHGSSSADWVVQQLKQRNYSIPDDYSGEKAFEDLLRLAEASSQLPENFDPETYQQMQVQLAQYQAQLPQFQKWLQEQGGSEKPQPTGDKKSGQSGQSVGKKASKELKFDLEPLSYEPSQIDPMADLARKNGMIRYNQATSQFAPAEGMENNTMAIAAANELTKHHLSETAFLEQFRDNPVLFAQRAVAPLLQQIADYVTENLGVTTQEIGQFKAQQQLAEANGYFTRNKQHYYVLDADGDPLRNLDGTPKLNERGALWAITEQDLRDTIPDESERYSRVTKIVEKAMPFSSQGKKSGEKPGESKQATGEKTHQGQAAPDVPAGQSAPADPSAAKAARKRSFTELAREVASKNGNGAAVHNRIANVPPEYLTGMRSSQGESKSPSLKQIAEQIKARST